MKVNLALLSAEDPELLAYKELVGKPLTIPMLLNGSVVGHIVGITITTTALGEMVVGETTYNLNIETLATLGTTQSENMSFSIGSVKCPN